MGDTLQAPLAGKTYPVAAVPAIGRIVHYRLSAQDAAAINQARHRAKTLAHAGALQPGLQAHDGNLVRSGDTFPMIITAVWGQGPEAPVNGQVFLDGTDQYWACTRSIGEGPGTWSWPSRA